MHSAAECWVSYLNPTNRWRLSWATAEIPPSLPLQKGGASTQPVHGRCAVLAVPAQVTQNDN